MRLLAMLASVLRMLLGIGGMFFALSVVTFAVLFCRGAMRFSSVFVVLGCLIMLISSHYCSPAMLKGTIVK
jgi:hypothetical protein